MAIRNIRRDANTTLKDAESQDRHRDVENPGRSAKLTDKSIAEVDKLVHERKKT